MTAAPPDVLRSTLALGPVLGTGGQGRVYDLLGRPGYAYKEYRQPVVHAEALTELVRFRASLPAADRELLDRSAAWPVQRVVDAAGSVKGVIMLRVPSRFEHLIAGRARHLELPYLTFPRKPLWADVPSPTARQRMAIVRHFVEVLDLLHRNGLIYGDISHANVLWTVTEGPGVYLLDCDGIRRLGRQAVMPQPETPDWNDPYGDSTAASQDGDRYKLALLAGRVLAKEPYVRPGEPLLLGDVPAAVGNKVAKLFAEAGGKRGRRPNAARWKEALTGREAVEPRVIDVPIPAATKPRAKAAAANGTRTTTVSPPEKGRVMEAAGWLARRFGSLLP